MLKNLKNTYELLTTSLSEDARLVLSYASKVVFMEKTLEAQPGDDFYSKYIDICMENSEYKQKILDRTCINLMKTILRLNTLAKRYNQVSVFDCFVEKTVENGVEIANELEKLFLEIAPHTDFSSFIWFAH